MDAELQRAAPNVGPDMYCQRINLGTHKILYMIMEKKMEITIIENQMEKNMENEMETGIIMGYILG